MMEKRKYVDRDEMIELLAAMGFYFHPDSDTKMYFMLDRWKYEISVLGDSAPFTFDLERFLRLMLLSFSKHVIDETMTEWY